MTYSTHCEKNCSKKEEDRFQSIVNGCSGLPYVGWKTRKVLISRIMQLARAYTKNHWTFYDFVTGGSAVLTQ